MPSNVAARMTLAADPGSLQGAVAAGILGAGPVVLGASEECARLLEQAVATGRKPGRLAAAARSARVRPAAWTIASATGFCTQQLTCVWSAPPFARWA